jgi:hypothetical protein
MRNLISPPRIAMQPANERMPRGETSKTYFEMLASPQTLHFVFVFDVHIAWGTTTSAYRCKANDTNTSVFEQLLRILLGRHGHLHRRRTATAHASAFAICIYLDTCFAFAICHLAFGIWIYDLRFFDFRFSIFDFRFSICICICVL